MIPWFIVSLVAALVRPFGYQVCTLATFGRWGADRIRLVREGEPSPDLIGEEIDRLNRR